MDGGIPFKGGRPSFRHCAFCLETQRWPDSPNHENFSDATEITTVEVNGVEWVYFEPVEGKQFMLFSECPSGGVIEIYGMFAPYEDCTDLVEAIELT